jgi:hypothetical protein
MLRRVCLFVGFCLGPVSKMEGLQDLWEEGDQEFILGGQLSFEWGK